MDFKTIYEKLNNLITEETPKESAELIVEVKGLIESAEADSAKNESELKELKNDYIKLIKTAGFAEQKGQEPEEKPVPTLESIISDVISKRK